VLIGARDASPVIEQGGAASCAGRVERQDHGCDCGHMRPKAATPAIFLDCFDAFDFGDIMTDEPLDAALEGYG
jgi:hypothetical protein